MKLIRVESNAPPDKPMFSRDSLRRRSDKHLTHIGTSTRARSHSLYTSNPPSLRPLALSTLRALLLPTLLVSLSSRATTSNLAQSPSPSTMAPVSFWQSPTTYIRWASRAKPAIFWSIVVGSFGPIIAITVPPIRARFGDGPRPQIPLTYPSKCMLPEVYSKTFHTTEESARNQSRTNTSYT